jgi:putative CocE/NonD family hydrolase
MSSIVVDRDVRVALRDGVQLATDIYRPREGGPHPTLLQRTPYDKADAQTVGGLMVNPLEAASHGYSVVVQDVRGRYRSDGDWTPIVNEAKDGYDTVEWAADQPWSDGRIGAYGPSYMGVTAWQAAIADPPHLEAVFPYLTGGDYDAGFTYTGGAFELGFNLWWVSYLLAFDTADRLDVPPETLSAVKRKLATHTFDIEKIVETLPITDIPGFDEVAPYWETWLEHPPGDSYWDEYNVAANADRITVPALHVTGWYDTYLRGHLDTYHAIRNHASDRARDNQYLVVGPWYHDQYSSETPTKVGDLELGVKAPSGIYYVEDLLFRWFDHWLNDDETLDGLPAMRYFDVGTEKWASTDVWPPDPTTRSRYLHSQGDANASTTGSLTQTPPEREPSDGYRYDPLDPVPTRGGRTTMPNLAHGGIKDRAELERRDDVVVYTASPQQTPLILAGPVELQLHAASSAPDTDFTATLVDVRPDGYCAPVAEGIIRIRHSDAGDPFVDPGADIRVNVDLGDVAYTYQPGHSIRLEISSSNFPRFDRNPNSRVPPRKATAADFEVATQRVFHDEERPSAIDLPVIE